MIGLLRRARVLFAPVMAALCLIHASEIDYLNLTLPVLGDHTLRIITPTLLEVTRLNSKPPGIAPVDSWDFVDTASVFHAPALSQFAVTVDGVPATVTTVGFKRRPLYAPVLTRDLRIENSLYLQLSAAITDGQSVEVKNPGGALWATGERYIATAAPLRYSPGIHVNQEGYVPGLPKKAMIGYYLGSLGELDVAASLGFKIVAAGTSTLVYQGTLTVRADVGYVYLPTPYQKVLEADFSSVTAPGKYQLVVPGLGASVPFAIDEGIAMSFLRTYALGLYEQRCGTDNVMPFTRFIHAACHSAPAEVPWPSSSYSFTWSTIAGKNGDFASNPRHTAPQLTSDATSLYPFVNHGVVDIAGGHHDAGDYSKYTTNSAELAHLLMFTADAIPGASALDNLGLPQSGDGISDILQEAKQETDYLAKLQDADGGFYFIVYPKTREYESNVLPENGDTQVVWPKNTAATAAAVAALTQAASSPKFKAAYPAAAALYLKKAKLGWQFLLNAIAARGKDGSYQKITFYGDHYMHDDELAWAACELFVATGETQYRDKLFAWFPDPSDSLTFRWGWWRMSECWGNAIRSYAFAVRTGRLAAGQLDAAYLAKCEAQIVAAGDDALRWSNQNSYATSFPEDTKHVLSAGWYFSLDQASDMATAYQISPKAAYLDALVGNMNYEAGTNPVNVTYLTGLGQKRQREIVSQYALNDRRVLPPTGIPLGNIQTTFAFLDRYGSELRDLVFPSDSAVIAPYQFYDRWADSFNVSTEYIGVNQARSLLALTVLATRTTTQTQTWKSGVAQLTLPTTVAQLNTPVTLTVQAPGFDLSGARIVWEARDQEPAFGPSYTISPTSNGAQWVEAEIALPDGRRLFATNSFDANSTTVNWVDGAIPSGGSPSSFGGDAWTWITPSPATPSGHLGHQSNIGLAGVEHGHLFDVATATMNVGIGDTMFAWVYLDPLNPPTEVMLTWNNPSTEHRAYWGDNTITWGNSNSPSRYPVGALPPTGQWVRLTVPASAVGLEGSTVSGMAFVLVGGRATWDTAGITTAVAPATAPTIATQPQPQTTTIGASASFAVGATGTAPLTYQWTRNGATLPGATSATVGLTNVQAADAASYAVVVSNAVGSALSNAASLTVNPGVGAPSMTTQPLSQTLVAGASTTFTVAATGTATLTYQWKHNGVPIAGATATSFTITGAAAVRDNGWYQAVVTNASGATTSTAAFVNVAIAPTQIVGWGRNVEGETTVPNGLNDAVAIAAGGAHAIALKVDGTVVAWGRNVEGQTSVPGGLNTVVALSAGIAHTLALKADGTVVAWGSNTFGQTTVPSGLTNVVSIAAGNYHSVALKGDGTVVTWGDNASGQTTIPAYLANVIAIAAGSAHTVALKSDGTVVAWGYNGSGQTTVPAALTNVSGIAAGYYHTVALKSDGTIVAWGWNGYGQTTVPVGLSSSIGIGAGGAHTVAQKADGSVVAWGDNTSGQAAVPIGATNVLRVVAGSDDTLALRDARILPVIGTPPANQSVLSGQPVTFSVIATGTPAPTLQWRKAGSAIVGATGASFTIAATVAADAGNYDVLVTNSVGTVTSTTATLAIGKLLPTITWATPAGIVFGTALSATQLNAAASVPGTFVFAPLAGVVLGAGAAQALSVTFTPTDAANYSTATGGTTITVNKATPAITWPAPAPIVYGVALSATQLNATASVPGTFVYAPIAGTVLSAGAAQTLSVTFTPTDAANNSTATGGTTITVNKATPAITWPAPAPIVYGVALSAIQLNATATVPGTFAYTPAAGTVLGAGAGQVLGVNFTPTDSANYSATTGATTITVSKITPTLTWPAPTAIIYGVALSAAQLNATASVPGVFVYTPAAGIVLGGGAAQVLGVTFTPTNTANYNNAAAATTITVSKATPVLTWAAPSAITYGVPLSATQLNATANVPGTFVYTPASGTVLNLGATQTLSVSFTPTTTANYNPVSATTTITVSNATPTITWPPPAAIVYGTPLSATQLNATADVPGAFVYNPIASTVLGAGVARALSLSFTPTDSTNYSATTAAATITVSQASQTITFAGPANMAFTSAGVALSATASSALPVSFTVVSGPATVSGSALTLTGAGTVVVRASQPGNANVLAAPDVDQSFAVSANFASWELGKFTAAELSDPNKSGPNAIFGIDGVSNLVKYALGLEPKQDVVMGLPEISVQGADWVQTYPRPTSRPDLAYAIEASTDLATWTTAGVTHELVSTAAGIETWRGKIPLASAVNIFLRLKIVRLALDTSCATPGGGMKLVVPAGQTRSLSLPLLHASVGAGTMLGRVAAVGSNFLDVTSAGWTPGGLSNVANPYYVRFRTGALAGRIIMVAPTANTASRVFLSNDGTDLTQTGLVGGVLGDVFELVLADTLSTLFGSGALQGGTNTATADSIQIWNGASWLTFYYSSANSRWQRDSDTAASPTRDTFLVRADRGLMITRNATTDLKYYVTGRVPELPPAYWHFRPGVTFLSLGLPVDLTLGSLALQSRATGWKGGTNYLTSGADSDLVRVWNGASWLTFYYDTTNSRWQRDIDAAQTNRASFVIPAGRPVMIHRLTNSASATDSLLPLILPYGLAP